MQPWLLLSLFALSSSCAHIEPVVTAQSGPLVVPCIVDLKSGGYQCEGIDQVSHFRSFQDATDLHCVSWMDLESFLKACKKGQLIPIAKIQGSPSCADNSFCLTLKEWNRLDERCAP